MKEKLVVKIADQQADCPVDEQRICQAVRDVLREEKIAAGEVSVAIVDDPTIQALNARHLGHDYPTDVISFLLDRRGDYLEGEVVVSIDTARAMGEAVEHLAELGHRRICYVSGPTQSVVNRRRWNRCQDAAEALELELTRVGPFSPWEGSGGVSADEVLATGATAAIAFNDVLAMGMLERFRELGVNVPGDMSVVGCDDILGSDTCVPPLTTISAPTLRVGVELTSLLLAAIGSSTEAESELDFPVQLTIRSSTGPAPAQ